MSEPFVDLVAYQIETDSFVVARCAVGWLDKVRFGESTVRVADDADRRDLPLPHREFWDREKALHPETKRPRYY